MITGTHTSCFLSRRHTSNPSKSGSVTSRTTAPYAFSAASHSPSVPFAAMSTA